ncbi:MULTISPECIES: GntP family permease [Pseudomonas]|jgi:H+/gluconate symporter-like permease|uniref:GntP family permease n=1 Tax=Pseudomonas TaxID=286 RepID=UPI000287A691|nr:MULTISPECIES: GntP family permease [Pseudomonas]AMB79692.1 transporter [Pseudomonas fragi]MCB1656453.1 GntP family permease [Pseudomonadales bacterium]AUB75445.1 transporter [Pseudomonas sp. Lz4W]NBG92603.1 GntP family permease [Pseudomonas sp. 9.1(2019)]RUT42199.1 GntP family permease [Pseudomonas sp. PAMC 29040]
MSTMAILISLLLLMFLAYRGVTVLILAPLMAALAVLLSGGATHIMPTYTQLFMKELGLYLIKFFPLFILGSLFGKLVADSGAAHTIADWFMRRLGRRHVILTVVLACALLTYGGVSLFVVAFAVYPIGAVIFRESGTPKRYMPAAIALGAFTFTMTALPGAPSIQNAIPTAYLGTTTFAAPGLGIIASVVMLWLGTWILQSRARKAMANGEGYGDHDIEIPSNDAVPRPGLLVALLPIIVVIGLNAAFSYWILPSLDLSVLREERFGSIDPASVVGLWSVLLALMCAIVFVIVLNWKRWDNLTTTINKGSLGAMLPIFNTASEVAYGAVIAGLAGFAVIKAAILNFSPEHPLISTVLSMNVLAGITGSSSGGLSIAFRTLGSDYLRMIEAAGISPELFHRVATIAAGGLDTLPHSGAVITLLAICGLSHRQSYPQIFMMTTVVPLTALLVVLVLGSTFGSF